MLTEQGVTHEKGKGTTSIGNSRRTMTRDQYWYNWTTPKIKRQECNYSHNELIH